MGIKRKLHHPVIKLEQRHGILQVVGGNSWYSYFRDPYHLVLTETYDTREAPRFSAER